MKRLALALLVLVSSLTSAQGVQLEREVFNIAGELRCPVCRSESAADSSAETSIEFRNIIRERLEAGESREEILAYFQQTYGDWILLDPPRRGLYLWVWGLPVAAGVLGLGTLGYFLTRWRKNAAAPTQLSAEEHERVRHALAQQRSADTQESGSS
jgi:cytochrome c-type biogenesis protein CcmH